MADDIREPIEQLFVNYTVAVATTPTQLNPSMDISAYVQSFFICNPSFNANNVFWGDGQVTASSAGNIGTGIEIIAGTTQQFIILQDRQFYEIQDSINDIIAFLSSQVKGCTIQSSVMKVPVVVWNPANFFLVAAVATTVSVSVMRNVYI